MRAIAVVPGTRRIELRDVESPRIASPTDVKLRVLDVGICGTDREISAFGTPPPGSEYLVIGHESLGQVIEVGAGVSRVRPGDWWCRWYAAPVRTMTASPVARVVRTSATRATSRSAASSNAMVS
jgi:D-arabinose 1-dehydrogenase-like Zn-dependent alcohol dehydrogenase